MRAAMWVLCGMMLWLSLAVAAQTGEYTVWTVFSDASYPGDLQPMIDGNLFVTIFEPAAIGLFNPQRSTLTLWETSGSPQDLEITNAGIFFTMPRESAIGWLQPDFNHSKSWQITAPSPQPSLLVDATSSDGSVELWFAEWMNGGLGLFEPTDAQLALPPDPGPEPQVYYLSARMKSVEPVSAVSQPVGYPARSGSLTLQSYLQDPWDSASPFRQWQPYTWETYVFGLARDPQGRIWISGDEQDPLQMFTPWENRLTYYELPGLMYVYGLASDAAGDIWFIAQADVSTKLGRVDPVTGDVTVWTIPDAIDVAGLTVVGEEIWFSEREFSAIYRFDPATDTFSWWMTGEDDAPHTLEPGEPGEIWATFERSGGIARLRLESEQ